MVFVVEDFKTILWVGDVKIVILVLAVMLLSGCVNQIEEIKSISIEEKIKNHGYPKIASWLAKKDELIAMRKPYDLIMTGWVTPEEAKIFREMNPNVIILTGLSVNWVYDNTNWMTFLKTIGNYGKAQPIEITEDMYLKKPNGERCGFGWASGEWGHEEIYAMDPKNPEWRELITSFYKNVLDQPQHDGIIIDMVTEKQWWCPEAISDKEWVEATKAIMAKIKQFNTKNKLVIFNSGRDLSDIDEYAGFFDGYLMENFLGKQLETSFDEGLKAADSEYIVIYAVDTDDTGQRDLKRMRLGLTLSLLNDNTYFSYDFGPRDHGQAWWFPEYDVELGKSLGKYYKKDNALWREFENGIVVSSPYSNVNVNFDEEYMDVTTGEMSKSFTIEKGDGKIFIRSGERNEI
ncbi:MAG: putative glycoside hydrolase [Candidatus Methanofastidiosia archaeon]